MHCGVDTSIIVISVQSSAIKIYRTRTCNKGVNDQETRTQKYGYNVCVHILSLDLCIVGEYIVAEYIVNVKIANDII